MLYIYLVKLKTRARQGFWDTLVWDATWPRGGRPRDKGGGKLWANKCVGCYV